MEEINFTDIGGITVGHAQDYDAATGCTVVLCEKGAMAGVMQFLEEHDVGRDVEVAKVPIVCGAALFDLAVGDFPLFNPAMRRALGLADDNRGVLVSNVTPRGPCDGVLEPGDVLLELDGHPIDSAGMVAIDGEMVNMHEIVERKFAGDKVTLGFLRRREQHHAEVTLGPLPWSRMYAIQYEKAPRYIVFAGLVFQPLDTNLYAIQKLSDIHVRRIYADYVPKGLFQQLEDVVVLTRIESDPLTSQLEGFEGMVLEKVNSVPVTSLAHAHQLLHPLHIRPVA